MTTGKSLIDCHVHLAALPDDNNGCYISPKLLRHQSKVGAGSFVLDIGCGSGLFCQMAAALGAQVSGLDASEALLEIARWRAPRGDFRAGEMEELPYSPKTFDLVTGLNSFQFAASPVNALVEARRVSKPGASVVIAVFGKPEDTEAKAFFAAMASILSPPPGAPGPFALSSEGALEALVTQAGLTPGVVQEIDCPWQYPDATTMLRGFLSEQGFLTSGPVADRRAVEERFELFHEDTSELRVTVLTTLQCNFACEYCVQGDHGTHNATARPMSLETASRVAAWVEEQLDAVRPQRLVLTFFAGEPLLNLPVVYYLAERLWSASQSRRVTMVASVITNGLLLTPTVVDRLLPFGLKGVKVTLDGDRETHDQMRPRRGGQGTFDRIINCCIYSDIRAMP